MTPMAASRDQGAADATATRHPRKFRCGDMQQRWVRMGRCHVEADGGVRASRLARARPSQFQRWTNSAARTARLKLASASETEPTDGRRARLSASPRFDLGRAPMAGDDESNGSTASRQPPSRTARAVMILAAMSGKLGDQFPPRRIIAVFFHADMHQGNLLGRSHGTIVAIDSGFMADRPAARCNVLAESSLLRTDHRQGITHAPSCRKFLRSAIRTQLTIPVGEFSRPRCGAVGEPMRRARRCKKSASVAAELRRACRDVTPRFRRCRPSRYLCFCKS